MPEKQLMPLSVILDHDGHELKIIRRLKSGLTGEVYEGTLALTDTGTPIRVAVKIMKALEFPMARIRFLQESETLAFLMHLEEEANKEQLLALKVAPKYYGRGEYEGSPYLVMEFIDGKDIPSILEKEGRLPEKQALTIAWHLYRTLDILHTRLKRTYIDLKFDDLWWVNDPDGQLKLLDFGTLEDIKPTDTQLRGVRSDLLLGGVYLFAMLTGRTLNYSLGELKERAEPLIRQYEANISWGTRRLLRRLLQRNPSSRPTSASAIAADLRTLVNFWNQPEDRLYSMVQNNLAEAETAAEQARAKNQPLSKQGRDSATRARSALDALHALYPGRDVKADIERAEKALSIGDYMERGTALLKGRSFAAARQIFEEGIQWSDDPALLRRWAFLAHAGEGISPSTFEKRTDEAVQALAAMGESHWVIALERLEKLEIPGDDGIPGFESEGLKYLKTEAVFFSMVEQAETARDVGEFKKAASIYRSAQVELAKLPASDARFIADEEVGDLSLLGDNMTVLAATREQAAKNYQGAPQSLEKNEWEKCVQLSREAYLTDRTAPFRNKELNQIARLALERASKEQDVFASAVRVARQVAGIGVWETPMDLELAGTWHLSSDFDNAETALEIRDGAGVQQAVMQAYVEAASDELLQPLTITLLTRADKFAESSPSLLHSLAKIYKECLGDEAGSNTLLEKAADLESKQRQEHQAEVDRRLDQVSFILAPISPESGRLASILEQAAGAASVWRGIDIAILQDRLGRLEDASTRLEETRRLAGSEGYRIDEIARLRSLVDKGLDDARASLEGQEKARREFRENQVAALSMERREIDSFRQWSRQAADLQVNLDAQGSVQLQLREKLVDFFYRCYQVLAGEKGAQVQAVARQEKMDRLGVSWEKMDDIGAVRVLAEWAACSLDELGEEAWQEVKQVAEQHQKKIQAGLEQARAAFTAGDLVRLSSELDRIEPEFSVNLEWQKLKQDLVKASSWKAWTGNRADVLGQGRPDLDLLRDFRDYLLSDLPESFWQQAGIPAYLNKAREVAKQEATQALKRKGDGTYDAEVVEALVQWLSVEWTLRRANPTSHPARRWNRLEWLRSVYRNSNLDQSPAALPDDIELAINSFSPADWQAVRADEKKAQADRIMAQKAARRAMIIIPIVLVFFALLGFAGYIIYKANQARIDQVLHGTYTPTITATPTRTLVPTETPTITSTPTETLTPTPIPPSSLNAPAVLYPALPVAGDAAWLLNLEKRTDPLIDQFIQAIPAFTDQTIWARDYSADPKAKGDIYFYTIKGNVTVSWQMDQPFEMGIYAVYVIDTVKNSVGSYTYSVMVDDVEQIPVRGQNTVTFQGAGQKADEWLPLGFYEVQSGQRMSVLVTAGQLAADTPFAVDRLLIVKVSESQSLLLDQLPANRTLVSLLDDDRARFFELNAAGAPVQVLDRGAQFTDSPAWNNSFASRDLITPLPVSLWVEWQPLSRLLAGTYELYVWIPGLHASVQANYALLVDGKPVQFDGSEVRPDTGPELYLRLLNQNDHSNVWYSLGTWTLLSESSVGVRLIVPANTVGAIGVDAVVLVKVGE